LKGSFEWVRPCKKKKIGLNQKLARHILETFFLKGDRVKPEYPENYYLNGKKKFFFAFQGNELDHGAFCGFSQFQPKCQRMQTLRWHIHFLLSNGLS